MEKREHFSSRLGFILISAGCAIGLGNVWRFPFITGAYGGACFLLIFIVCQLMVMPVMLCEFAVGRASRRNMGLALKVLEPKGTYWHKFGWIALAGSYLLLMFYTTITGWMLIYCVYMMKGTFVGMAPAEDPRVVVAIVIEDGEEGVGTAKAQNVLKTALEVQGLL